MTHLIHHKLFSLPISHQISSLTSNQVLHHSMLWLRVLTSRAPAYGQKFLTEFIADHHRHLNTKKPFTDYTNHLIIIHNICSPGEWIYALLCVWGEVYFCSGLTTGFVYIYTRLIIVCLDVSVCVQDSLARVPSGIGWVLVVCCVSFIDRYVWKKDGEIFDLVDRPNITRLTDRGGSFIIRNPNSTSDGIYQCFASNSYGTAVTLKTALKKAGQLKPRHIQPSHLAIFKGLAEPLLSCFYLHFHFCFFQFLFALHVVKEEEVWKASRVQ